jgi:hypothetical protein
MNLIRASNQICVPLPGLGDHEIVYIGSDISAKLNKPVKRKIYIWKKANKDKLEDQASEMVKQFKEKCILDRAINDMCDFFKSNILKILFSTFFLGDIFELTVSCNVTFLFGSSSFVEASFLPPRHLFYCAVNPQTVRQKQIF